MHDRLPLGASLYVPCTHPDLLAIARGHKYPTLRSVIFCLEDSVAPRDLARALANLAGMLRALDADGAERPLRLFMRPRDPRALAQVMALPGVQALEGFVLAKLTADNFDAYWRCVERSDHLLMPTLETVEVFEDEDMKRLRARLLRADTAGRILALRIGGNDLLALLGIRRSRHCTIYRTPLGAVIGRLVTLFRPYGFALTAPVFEYLDTPDLLEQELVEDLIHGLVGKTAIHPDQVARIDEHYRVHDHEYEMATRLLAADSPAVFRMHDAMCEVATHREWAVHILQRARVFGLRLRGGSAA